MIIGGAQENTLLNCLDLIREYGDDVLLITGPALGPEGDLLSQGRAGELPVKVLPSLRRDIHPKRDWLASREISKALLEFQPDVVHTHSAKGGLLGRRSAWKLNVPAVVHTIHGAPFHPYQSRLARDFFRRCEQWASKRCHHLVSVADAMTELMVEAGVAPREKFTTIYSGMNVEPFTQAKQNRAAVRQEYGFGDEHVVIGKIARLFHLKGHRDLINAAVPVVRSQPNVRFLLVGDGVLRESLTQQINELGLSKHFVFAGLVPPSEVPKLIGGMDALVHASYREGLARALPQALIAGLPVISYDVDGAREVTITGQTGILVPAQDVSALSQALGTMAGDRDLRKQLGAEGQRRFTEQFDHRTMTARVRELYQEQIAEK
ncbi:glycosyltransferase family 4 protein [Rhodopirellula sp.]|nr:glycosyltransferase family 4 protein [Rubripirellula sp.]MDA7904845.1 glycosyltransferase family 4 protein [Rhodopirellula sp.]MDA8968261.1 glycosyltransferase family 4 protein [bacterium]MDB4644645.1 glycosyltransferase family 4 protein [Rubripirellula sp.]